MFDKRIILFAGHYGSGKTSCAISCTDMLLNDGHTVALADLDIVNPYFRAKDEAKEFIDRGVDFICSDFANSNVDLPALPQSLYSITDRKDRKVVIDVGGDDRGALALGRLTPYILEENDYEMLLVINKYRPLTATPQDVYEIKCEIETACKIPFTAILNNSNLGYDTSVEVIKDSFSFADDCSKLCNLPIFATSCNAELCKNGELGKTKVFPLNMVLKNKYI